MKHLTVKYYCAWCRRYTKQEYYARKGMWYCKKCGIYTFINLEDIAE